jgi:hypothetical protein
MIVLNEMIPRIMDDVCSINETISDTYYDKELKKCVLTQCIIAQNGWGNKSQCYYEPPNITAINGVI